MVSCYKVPYEQLHKAFRNSRKHLEREFTFWQSIPSIATTSTDNTDENDNMSHLKESVLARLTQLKRKLKESQIQESQSLKKCRIRLDHLNQLTAFQSVDDDGYRAWSEKRLYRLVVDYLLRMGYFETADRLSQAVGIGEYVDVELFASSRKIEESLRAKSCGECLQWCVENRSHLKRQKSPLEFWLRVQEFVEMVRVRDLMGALVYARKYFGQWVKGDECGRSGGGGGYLDEVREVMGLLAFPVSTKVPKYRKYYDESRWHMLVQQFRQDNYSLNQLTSQTVLAISLQAGLTALKTPQCFVSEHKNINCPVCNEPYTQLSRLLPFSHHINSCVVCRMTGAVMDEDNPPMVLPNGNVYSMHALKQMAGHGAYGKGRVMDPHTQNVYDYSECKKAYLT